MKWKIYYGDGSTYTSEYGTPQVAPSRDVQVIVQDHPRVGVELVSSADYYVWMVNDDYARWWGVDIFGLFDYLVEAGWKRVLFGRTLLQEEYNEIVKEASEDKSGWTTLERKAG